MTFNTKEILTAVERVLPGVGSDKALLVGVDNILFESEGLHTFNSRICITYPIDTRGLSGSISGDKLFKILKKIKADTIEISATEDGFEITAGKTIVNLNYMDAGVIPAKIGMIHADIETKKLSNRFVRALQLCGIKGNSSKWSGVLFHENKVYGTNQVVSNFLVFPKSMGKFWLSQKSVEDILKIKTRLSKYAIVSGTAGEWLHLYDDENTLFSFILQDLTNFTGAIGFLTGNDQEEDTEKFFHGTLPVNFKEAVDECSILSTKSDDAKMNFIAVSLNKKEITLTAGNKKGNITTKLEWKSSPEMEEGITNERYYCDYLKDLAEKSDEILVKPFPVAGGKTLMLLIGTGVGFKTMLCPLFEKG